LVQIDVYADGVGARVGQRVEHDDGSSVAAGVDVLSQMPAGRVVDTGGQVVRLAPAREQVEVDLIGLRAGHRIVVGAEQEQPPCLVQCGSGIGGAVQRGERGPLLSVQQQGLHRPVGLFGVNRGDVLAGVDRVHVPGLWGGTYAPCGEFGSDRGEELSWQRA
jgi:hypothetical protein